MKSIRFPVILLLAAAVFAAVYIYFLNKEPAIEGVQLVQQRGIQNQSIYKSESTEYDKTWSYLLPYCKTYISADFIQKLRDESVPAEKRFDKAFDSTPLLLISLFQGGARREFYREEDRYTSDTDPNKYKVVPEFFIHYLEGHSNELIYKNPHPPLAVGYYHLEGNQTSLVAGNGSYTEKASIMRLDSSTARIKLRFGTDSLEFTGIDITTKMNEIRVKQEEIDHGFFVHLLDKIAAAEFQQPDSSFVDKYLQHFLNPGGE